MHLDRRDIEFNWRLRVEQRTHHEKNRRDQSALHRLPPFNHKSQLGTRKFIHESRFAIHD
jgi:hypothetical protein